MILLLVVTKVPDGTGVGGEVGIMVGNTVGNGVGLEDGGTVGATITNESKG